MTERLYYTDPYLRQFDATVLSIEELPDGRRAAILDRTAFYPSSGGQPYDVGMLGRSQVVDVIEREDGEIVHVIEGEIHPGPAHGEIDWSRRFEHMQQHTGQHVLSAAFDKLHAVRTVSFHLGSVSSTIDLAREVRPDEIVSAEAAANRVVWDNVPVTIRFAESAEAATLPLRKESAREGLLRLIDIDGFDLSACGGTHVSRTGAIGIIAIASWERFRAGPRVEFLCGSRTLAGFGRLRDIAASSSRLLSVAAAELPVAIERLQHETRESKRQVRALQERLARYEAAALAERAEPRGATRLVVQAIEDFDQTGLKAIASAIAERPAHVVVLFSLPAPSSVVIARAADLKIDCAGLLKQLTARFGGRGGGRPELAQGGGLGGSSHELLAAARTLIES